VKELKLFQRRIGKGSVGCPPTDAAPDRVDLQNPIRHTEKEKSPESPDQQGSQPEFGKLSNASVYLAANIANTAIPFFLLPILTRVLAPAEYGTVALFEAAVACLGAFTGLSTNGAVGVQYFKEERGTFSQYVGVCLLILLGSTLLTIVVLTAGAPFVERFTGLSSFWLMFAVLVSSAQFLVNIRLVIWQSSEQAMRYGVFQIAQTALNASISLFLVLYLGWGAPGRMAGFAISVIIFGLIGLVSLQANRWIAWKWNLDYFRDAVHFGLPLIPHTLGTLAVAFADRFIITKKLGIDATGHYFVAVQLSMPLLLLGSSFNRAFVPWLFKKLADKENVLAVTISYLAIGGFFLAGVFYSLFVYFGLPLIIGERFQQAKPIALILILGTSFQASYYAVVNYIFYAKTTAYLSAITFVLGVIYIGGAWIVVPNFGLSGMAVLFAFVQCMTFFLVWIAGSIVLPQPWFDFSSMRKTLQNFAN
jgi:O-antigen/teichoic acid export membrane protein